MYLLFNNKHDHVTTPQIYDMRLIWLPKRWNNNKLWETTKCKSCETNCKKTKCIENLCFSCSAEHK